MEVERLQREYPVRARWSPYLLDPTIPPEGKTRSPQTTADAPKTHLEQRAEVTGLTFRRGRTFTPNSHLALEAAEFASDHGGHVDAFHRALFKAHFEDSENIGDLDVLVRIGGQNGIDGAELRAALDGGRYRAQVDEQIEWARSVGITGVPTFIFNDRYAVVGAQEYPVFQRVMEELGYPQRGEDATPTES